MLPVLVTQFLVRLARGVVPVRQLLVRRDLLGVRMERKVLGQELLLVSGQEAAVDVCGGLAGDDVDLVAGVQLGRVGRVAEGGPDELGEARSN